METDQLTTETIKATQDLLENRYYTLFISSAHDTATALVQCDSDHDRRRVYDDHLDKYRRDCVELAIEAVQNFTDIAVASPSLPRSDPYSWLEEIVTRFTVRLAASTRTLLYLVFEKCSQPWLGFMPLPLCDPDSRTGLPVDPPKWIVPEGIAEDIWLGVVEGFADREEANSKAEIRLTIGPAMLQAKQRLKVLQLAYVSQKAAPSSPQDGQPVSGVNGSSRNAHQPNNDFAISDDGRCINWKGDEYQPTQMQGLILLALYEAWGRGLPDVPNKTLLKKAQAAPTSIVKSIFKSSALWQTLVISKSRGTYRLNLPEITQ
jgi:hypothetical protein